MALTLIGKGYHNKECFRLYKTNYTYYIGDRQTQIAFELGKEWLYVDGKRKTMTDHAIQTLLQEFKKQESEPAVAEFLNQYVQRKHKHYEILIGEETPIKGYAEDKKTTEVSMELEKKLDQLITVMGQNNKINIFEQTMLDSLVDKVRSISTIELEKQIHGKLERHIESVYGKLPTRLEIVTPTITKQQTGIFHEKYETILKIVASKTPLMLVGSAGSGKNHTLEQIADALGLEFYFSNNITQEYKLTGFIDAGGIYHETEFYKAFKNGGLFMLDEIDASSPDALTIINAAIANRYFDFPNGRIHAHEDFRIVAAGNTFGQGADVVYVGRSQLDGATLDRFVTVEFEYSEQVELALCENDRELYDFIKQIRRAINENRMRHIVSMRATINAHRLAKSGVDMATIVKGVIVKSMNKDDLRVISQKLNGSSKWFNTLRMIGEK